MLYQLSVTTSCLKIKFVRFRSKYITGPIWNKLLHGLHSMARPQITCGGVGLKLQTCIRKKKLGLNLSWVAVYPNKYSVVFLANMPWSSSFKYLTTDHPRPSSLLSGWNTDDFQIYRAPLHNLIIKTKRNGTVRVGWTAVWDRMYPRNEPTCRALRLCRI